MHSRHIRDLVLLAILPVLAVLGLAGPRTHEVIRSTPTVEVAVEHVRLTRVSRPAHLRFMVSTLGTEPVAAVWVSVPEEYLSGFSTRRTVPGAETPHHVQLTDLLPGRPQAVEMELHAARAGLHAGSVRIETAGGDTLWIPLRTLILP